MISDREGGIISGWLMVPLAVPQDVSEYLDFPFRSNMVARCEDEERTKLEMSIGDIKDFQRMLAKGPIQIVDLLNAARAMCGLYFFGGVEAYFPAETGPFSKGWLYLLSVCGVVVLNSKKDIDGVGLLFNSGSFHRSCL